MVRVMFGKELPDTITNIDVYFNNTYELSWFEDDIVKKMIKDIDDSEVIGNCINSKYLGTTSVENLSGGVKALIVMLKDEELEYPIDLICCGENCQSWLSYIFSIKDITVSMTGVHLSFKNLDIRGICLNDNSEITCSYDWCKKMSDCLGEYYVR